MSYKTMLAVASAVLLSASGAAIASGNHAMGAPQTEAHGMTSNSYLKGIRDSAMIPNDRALLDAPVLNAIGQQIGEVTRITPGGVVISVGHKMGIGGHQVMLDPSNLTATRHHGKLAVISSLNEGQLDHMPDYHPGGAETGHMR